MFLSSSMLDLDKFLLKALHTSFFFFFSPYNTCHAFVRHFKKTQNNSNILKAKNIWFKS